MIARKGKKGAEMSYVPFFVQSPVYYSTATGAVIMYTSADRVGEERCTWRVYYSENRLLYLGKLAGHYGPVIGDHTHWGVITERIVPEPPQWAVARALACYREFGPGREPRDTYWNCVEGPAYNVGSELGRHLAPVQLYTALRERGLAVSTSQPNFG